MDVELDVYMCAFVMCVEYERAKPIPVIHMCLFSRRTLKA